MGGSSGAEQPAPVAAAPTGFPGQLYNMSMPMMPTQLNDIAAQLNHGYGGDHLAQLQKMYSPTKFSGYQNFPGMNAAPAPATSAPAVAAAQGAPAGNAPGNGLIYDQMIARLLNPSANMVGLGGGQY